MNAQQQAVGATAADLYRATPDQRLPVLALNAQDAGTTSDVLYRQALADRDDRALEGVVVRAERTASALAAAHTAVTEAQNAVTTARTQATDVLISVRAEVKDLSPAVTAQLAALGAIPTAGAQQDRNSAALVRWQN